MQNILSMIVRNPISVVVACVILLAITAVAVGMAVRKCAPCPKVVVVPSANDTPSQNFRFRDPSVDTGSSLLKYIFAILAVLLVVWGAQKLSDKYQIEGKLAELERMGRERLAQF